MSRHVFKRAAEDEAHGDLGSARDRLAASAAGTGFPAETCEAVARLSVRMHDPIQAGRWFLLTACDDEEALKAIEFFLDEHDLKPNFVLNRFPKGVISQLRCHPIPRNLQIAFERMGVADLKAALPSKSTPPSLAANAWDKTFSAGCFIIALILLASIPFGLVPLWRNIKSCVTDLFF